MTGEADAGFEDLLAFLQQSRGFDFSGYKRASLMRRVGRRLQMLGIGSFEEYKDYLEVHQAEFALLFNTILINVTSFFRDPEAWDYLAGEVVPGMLERKPAGSAGARLVSGLRRRPGGLHHRHGARRDHGLGSVPRARQDLRHRRRRGGARAGAPGELLGEGGRDAQRRAAGALLRPGQRPLRVPQRPAARGDLRPQRPDGRRADLAPGPAGVPQYADVLQRRGAGPDPRPLPLRPERRRQGQRHAVPRPCRDAAHPRPLFVPLELKYRVFAKVVPPSRRALLPAGSG